MNQNETSDHCPDHLPDRPPRLGIPRRGRGHRPSTSLISVTSSGKKVNTDNEFAQMSSDGRFVVFESGGKFTKGDDGNDSDRL